MEISSPRPSIDAFELTSNAYLLLDPTENGQKIFFHVFRLASRMLF